jgi:glyoxylase-like metal-dependent hydrolase (beta-lactamase superfamily II)
METRIGIGPVSKPRRLNLGDIRLTFLDGGELWLDGGAMFGIIPKPMWSRLVHVDEANRIPLAMTCTLVETAGQRILIETGAGAVSKYSEKEQGFFRFGKYWLIDSLNAAGIDPGDIDIVLLTHLHFDHAGGGTMPDGRGGYKPTFPRARYIVQRGDWSDAVESYAVMTGTYRPENLEPLESAGVLSFVHGDAEIVPGLSAKVLRGHTRHQQGVMLNSGGEGILLPADVLPTAAHVGLRYNMAYDLLPYDNMVSKAWLLGHATASKSLLLLGQDPTNPVWRPVRQASDRYSLESVRLDAV